MYALIALGYTMVYGIVQLINFAHGEFFMVGAYLGALVLSALTGTPLWIALLVAMLSAGMLAVITEFIAYRPLRNQPRIFVLTAAIAVSVLLQNLGQVIFGAASQPFPASFPEGSVAVNGVWIDYSQLFILGLCLIMMLALWLIVNKTPIGRAMRATSQDLDAARLMGININFVISFTFFLGACLAGSVGVLYGMTYSIDPLMGIQPGLAAFVAAVVGGIGSIPGAMIGGLLIGIIENMVAGYVSSTYQGAITFFILIIVLAVRPTGLMGKFKTVKV
jgi:branched-chain amino acid transport system permease protein